MCLFRVLLLETRELCGANKWMGSTHWVGIGIGMDLGWDLYVGLLYEHRFVVLVTTNIETAMLSNARFAFKTFTMKKLVSKTGKKTAKKIAIFLTPKSF